MHTRPPAWPVASALTALPLPFAEAVALAARLGFGHVEVAARAGRAAEDLEALADAGVLVPCAALGLNLPAGHGLDARDVGVRRATLRLLQEEVADAARLGATCAWLAPGADAGATALACFAEGCGLLAAYASRRMVRLCLAPAP